MMRTWMLLLWVINASLFFFPLSALPSAQSQENTKYTVGPEDVIEIAVDRHPEFSGSFHVDMDGKIQYTYVGDMSVTGLDKAQLEQKIKTAISQYCVNPQVNVIITQFQSKSIYVLGEVAHPGKYTIHAQHISVKEAIVMAGLPSETAVLRRGLVITDGHNKNIRDIDLYALLYQGDNSRNIMLNPGDTLYVPGGALKAWSFYVLGEVSKPGKYAMNGSGISVKEALMVSGMPTKTASLDGAKIIRKDKTSGSVNLNSQLYPSDTAPDVILYPGDTLYVPSMETHEFFVVGEVLKPGRYRMGGPRVSLKEALMLSGMPTKTADLNGAKIISKDKAFRMVNVHDQLYSTDRQEEFLSAGETLYMPARQLQAFYVVGDVPRPGKYTMAGNSISVKEALMASGLPMKTAALNKATIIRSHKEPQTVPLYDLLYSTRPMPDIWLRAEETLYIPAVFSEFQETADPPDDNGNALRYTLGPDDVLTIHVANYPEFSGVYTVSLEGKLQFPFAGDIYVTGLTKKALEDKIKGILSSSIAHPQVSVLITEFRSKAFYVIGEVNNPGKYFMRADTISVSEAVVMAGLPTLGAAMRKTQIITPGPKRAVIRRVNLYALLYNGNLRENLLLKPGDYLYVPSTVMAKVYHLVVPVTSTVGSVTSVAGPAPVIK